MCDTHDLAATYPCRWSGFHSTLLINLQLVEDLVNNLLALTGVVLPNVVKGVIHHLREHIHLLCFPLIVLRRFHRSSGIHLFVCLAHDIPNLAHRFSHSFLCVHHLHLRSHSANLSGLFLKLVLLFPVLNQQRRKMPRTLNVALLPLFFNHALKLFLLPSQVIVKFAKVTLSLADLPSPFPQGLISLILGRCSRHSCKPFTKTNPLTL
mmetsp:Transcript_36323/g.145253  ORF Transcript_36323/g.145253 Transcript_36323/m.145253 type:complete len:208 (-) Transcript_36323:124-747(-)